MIKKSYALSTNLKMMKNATYNLSIDKRIESFNYI